MNVKTIYINTYKYDFNFAKICISSVRYWYPEIEIKLIKDYGAGDFDTRRVEKIWNVGVLNLERRIFGWGYGKLEPLFLNNSDSFLVLDADTVITGPVLGSLDEVNSSFVVDDEVIPIKRFNEIYYNLDRINELAPGFKFPGYGFNSGQWFGTSGVLDRHDFERSLRWSNPPKPLHPEIVFDGDQAHLNFVIHYKEQFEGLKILRKRIMIWPAKNKADFLDLSKIENKSADYPYVIHWAGMKYKSLKDLPRADVINFYADLYYKKMGPLDRYQDQLTTLLIPIKKKWKHFVKTRL